MSGIYHGDLLQMLNELAALSECRGEIREILAGLRLCHKDIGLDRTVFNAAQCFLYIVERQRSYDKALVRKERINMEIRSRQIIRVVVLLGSCDHGPVVDSRERVSTSVSVVPDDPSKHSDLIAVHELCITEDITVRHDEYLYALIGIDTSRRLLGKTVKSLYDEYAILGKLDRLARISLLAKPGLEVKERRDYLLSVDNIFDMLCRKIDIESIDSLEIGPSVLIELELARIVIVIKGQEIGLSAVCRKSRGQTHGKCRLA